MLWTMRIDHAYDFGSVQSKIISVIESGGRNPAKSPRFDKLSGRVPPRDCSFDVFPSLPAGPFRLGIPCAAFPAIAPQPIRRVQSVARTSLSRAWAGHRRRRPPAGLDAT